MPSPAPACTMTSCPADTYSRTAIGVKPTRYSWGLISRGTPTFISAPWVWLGACSLVALAVCFHSMYDEKEFEYGENRQQSGKTRSIRATALDRSPGSSLVSRLEPQRP